MELHLIVPMPDGDVERATMMSDLLQTKVGETVAEEWGLSPDEVSVDYHVHDHGPAAGGPIVAWRVTVETTVPTHAEAQSLMTSIEATGPVEGSEAWLEPVYQAELDALTVEED